MGRSSGFGIARRMAGRRQVPGDLDVGYARVLRRQNISSPLLPLSPPACTSRSCLRPRKKPVPSFPLKSRTLCPTKAPRVSEARLDLLRGSIRPCLAPNSGWGGPIVCPALTIANLLLYPFLGGLGLKYTIKSRRGIVSASARTVANLIRLRI